MWAKPPHVVENRDVRGGSAHKFAMDAEMASENQRCDNDVAIRQLTQTIPSLLFNQNRHSPGAAAELHGQCQSDGDFRQMGILFPVSAYGPDLRL